MLVGVLVFIFALLASIALHELGHLLTAKRYGMKASRYFIGMGPTLWSTHRGETEYGVKALPIGGFVKIVGMTQLDEIDPQDEPRAFWRFPARQRAVVLAAGSFTHFVLAIVLTFAWLVGYGEPLAETTRIAVVPQCLEPAADGSCATQPVAPARRAGVQVGDRVRAFEGREIGRWQDFVKLVNAHEAGPATLVVERAGRRVPLVVEVTRVDRPDPDTGKVRNVGVIGVAPGETKRYGPVAAIGRTFSNLGALTVETIQALGALPGQIPELVRDTAKGEDRTLSDGKPVGVPDVVRLSGQAVESGNVAAVLTMIAGLNLFVGVFNLLPLLPLDGGHLAILGFESVRSRIARALGRPDPGRVDLRPLMPATVAFIVLMGSLTVMLVYASFANPIANPF